MSGSNRKPTRDPWLSATLSFLCPGLGQIHEGKSVAGGILLSLFVVNAGVMQYLIHSSILIQLPTLILVPVAIVWILQLASGWHAYHLALPRGADQVGASPFKAVAFAALFPPIGGFVVLRRLGGMGSYLTN